MGIFRRSREDPKKELTEQQSYDVGLMTKKDFPKSFFHGYVPLMKHPEIVAGVDKIADLISNMTIQMIKKEKTGHEKRISNGLSRKIDIYPNKWMTRKTFINNIVRTLLLTGNQVTVPVYSKEGLDNLIPIVYNNVSFNPLDLGYSITVNGNEVSPDNVLHFILNPDINFPYEGKGYSFALKDILDNLTLASRTTKGYMSQKYSPSMIIAVEADGSADSWPETRKMIMDDYIETSEVGAPMVIPSSMMKVESIQPLTLKDLAINETIQLDKKTVAAVLGIPAFVLGVGEFKRDEYNNFIETKIKSVATIIQQEMTKKLIFSEDIFLRFNHHSLLDYSLTEWSEILKEMKAMGVVTGNEVRNKLGFEYSDDPEQDEFSMLENYIKLKDIDKQKKLIKEEGE